MSEVTAYVGVNVTVALGGVTVAQATNAFVEYIREIHEIPPLGQEEKVYRRGHRVINWQVSGAICNNHAWAFLMGSKSTNQGIKELDVFKNVGTEITTEDITTYMNDYVDIPLVIEMEDPTSNERQSFTLTGVKGTRIRAESNRGIATQRWSGVATDLKVSNTALE